jgi:GNAT superfamily N-acetyltransferase
VSSVLRELGFTPDPDGTDADVEDSYLRSGGSFDVLTDPSSRVVGTVGLYPLAGGRCELRKMYLAADCRGRGLCRRLLAHALGRARQLGFRRVELEKASSLVAAGRLYESFGFRPFAPDHMASRCDRANSLDLGDGDIMPRLRLATTEDIPRLRVLIEQSVRALSAPYYTGPQIESALRYVFAPAKWEECTQLIADRTYYVIESDEGELIAAGGWGRRRTLHGGEQMTGDDDPFLDPATEAARIRRFFVHPAWARRGLGRQLFERCAEDAALAGFRKLELMATLPGEPLYRALGFAPLERTVVPLPDGTMLPVVHMARTLSAPPVCEPGWVAPFDSR